MRERIKKETVRRLAKWVKGNPQPPVRIDLEPTLSCNLKCKFCWQRSEERIRQCNYSNPLSEERILEIVDEAAELGVLEWQIAGGWEPMVKSRFCIDLMSRIKKYDMYGCLTTNGTLFLEEDIKRLVKIGWDQILFSLEGPDAKIHDSLTGVKGSFNKSVEAMSLFKGWKQKLRMKKPSYSFHTVLTNKNYTRLEEMIRWGYKLGTCGVCFEPLNVWSKEGAKLKLDEEQTKEFQNLISSALKTSKKLNIPTNLKSLQEINLIRKEDMEKVIESDIKKLDKKKNCPLLTVPCFNPWLNLEIRISGHVVPCRLCDTHQYANKIHKKSLKEIWYGSYFNRIRNQILKNKLPRYCNTCASGVVIDFRELREELLHRNILSMIKDRIKDGFRKRKNSPSN
jgi:MoaA/NifB/PqqE/SkfB family radical SAM enzyme